MKSTILIHLFALPAVLASLKLEIVVQEGLKDVTTVAGKRNPDDKTSAPMGYDLFLTESQCWVKDTTEWISTNCPDDQPKYLKVGEFVLEGSKDKARPFRITTSEFTQPVS
jgi:hypothetical protein